MGGYQQLPITPYNPQQPDLLGEYGKVMQLKNMATQGQIQQQTLQENELKLQQQKQAMAADEAFRQVLAQLPPGATLGDVLPQLRGKIGLGQYLHLQEADRKMQAEMGKMTKEKLDILDAAHKQALPLYEAAMNMPDAQYQAQFPQIVAQYNAIPGVEQKIDPNKFLSKQELAQQGPLLALSEAYTTKEIAKREAASKATIQEIEAQNMLKYGTKEQRKEVPGVDVPFPAKVQKQKVQIAQQSRAINNFGIPGEAATPDPNSAGILAQTGLSYPAFTVLTGNMRSLPRDAATRNRAMKEAQDWAQKRGVDVSTMGSQYQAQNEVLKNNIMRYNNTKMMEGELQGTIQNLQGVVSSKDLGSLRIENVAKIWAGQQVNDNLAQQYALHLYQLRTELAAYAAATQGRSGNQIMLSDQQHADQVILKGLSTGSLQGLETAVANSTQKMGVVMESSVERARKGVWKLFGVEGNYKGTAGAGAATGGTVRLTDNGKVYNIPANMVDEFKKDHPNAR